MIGSFRSKSLARLFLEGRGSGIRPDLVERCRRRLSALNSAEVLADLNIQGFSLHRLQGSPVRHSIHVNGPWCITFEWSEGTAWRVDLEQYH